METKITVTFTDGSRRVLKSPEKLEKIDENREACFVMDTDRYIMAIVMVKLTKKVIPA